MTMLGGNCDPCCNAPPSLGCDLCPLPQTVAVTVNIDPDTYWRHLTVSILSETGSGAVVVFDGPSARPSDAGFPIPFEKNLGDILGPVTGATLQSAGSGYAVLDPETNVVTVAQLQFVVLQDDPSDGDGLELAAVVDDDPESATFGQITEVSIVNAGDGYLANRYVSECYERLNGQSVVLQQVVNAGGPGCDYTASNCFYNLLVRYVGVGGIQGDYPLVTVTTPFEAITLTGTRSITHCDAGVAFEAEYQGSTASVEEGGEFTGDVPYPIPDTVVASISFTGAASLDLAIAALLEAIARGNCPPDGFPSTISMTRNEQSIDPLDNCGATPGFDWESNVGGFQSSGFWPLPASPIDTPCSEAHRAKDVWASTLRYRTDSSAPYEFGSPYIFEQCEGKYFYSSMRSAGTLICFGADRFGFAFAANWKLRDDYPVCPGQSLLGNASCPDKRFGTGFSTGFFLAHITSWSPFFAENVVGSTPGVTVTLTE